MSSKAILDKAHEYNVTVTAFFIGILLKAIFEEMPVSELKKPVTISVPVNLRKYFDSASARNFFGIIYVSYDFSKLSSELKDIVLYVNSFLKKELDKEKIKFRMNSLIGVEKNKVDEVINLIGECSSQRKKITPVNNTYIGDSMLSSMPIEVTVGGATIFVLDVEQFYKI